MRFPNYDIYKILYAKYLLGDRSEQLIELAGDIKDKIFMDICCGGGKLTTEAHKKGTKKNIMIDCEARMFSKEYDFDNYAYIHIMDVWRALMEVGKKMKIDIAICQQGINYWLSEKHVQLLYGIMNDGGIFIFNTFNTKPPKKPKVKKYSLPNIYGRERHYIEASWLVGKDVHHVQMCDGFAPHTTCFKWMSENYIKDMLEPYFNIELIRDKKTSIYKCIRK